MTVRRNARSPDTGFPPRQDSRARVLKRDAAGTVSLLHEDHRTLVIRDTRSARFGAGWLARRLARREADALRVLADVAGLPQLVDFDGRVLRRTHLAGEPLHMTGGADPTFFRRALALLRRVHRAGVVHNDLAKEPNWLRTETGDAALIDFQLAAVCPRRGRLFRLLAREDLRHLLKHKRCYAPQALTARQRALLASPGWTTRAWRALVKPPYRFVTRRLLGWPEREGPEERQR